MNMTSAAVMGICLGIACFHFFIASVANVLEGTLLALRPINHLLLTLFRIPRTINSTFTVAN